MKISVLSLTILALVSAQEQSCLSFYEYAAGGTFNGETYAGNGHGGGPFYYAETPIFENDIITESSIPIGFIQGDFFNATNSTRAMATIGFHFYETNSWIVGMVGFFYRGDFDASTPHIIIEGTNEYSGIKGSVSSFAISFDPFIIEYTICPPQVSPGPLTECMELYELSGANQIGNQTFLGTVEEGEGEFATGVFDSPIFLGNDTSTEPLAGRMEGHFFRNLQADNAVGTWMFYLLEDDSKVVGHLGFGDGAPTSDAIVGGSGQFLDTTGTISSVVVTEDPFVIKWSICPEVETVPPPTECTKIYELSSFVGTLGNYSFTGTNEGLLDTPFFATADDFTKPIGRVQGKYFAYGDTGVSVGDWAFNFFEEDDWLNARFGFGEGKPTPNMAVGGTKRWASFEGTVTNTVTQQFDFEVIEWSICPTGVSDGPKTEVPTQSPSTSVTAPSTRSPTGDPSSEDSSTSFASAHVTNARTLLLLASFVALIMMI